MAAGRNTRHRAPMACKRCHQRRVKCDASTSGIPCTRCKEKNAEDCALIQSKRGTYDRRKWMAQKAQAGGQSTDPTQHQSPTDVPETNSPMAHTQINESSQSHDPPIPESLDHDAAANPFPSTINLTSAMTEREDAVNDTPRSASGDTAGWLDGQADEIPQRRDGGLQPQANATWASLFDHFLEKRQDHQQILDKGSITYLGESFPLAIVLEGLKEGGRLRLHHPGPESPDTTVHSFSPGQYGLNHPSHISAAEIACLNSKEAFILPKKEALDGFVSVFLERFYPIYPIVNRQEFLQQYHEGTVPLNLLQAICFIGATFGPASVIHSAGFASKKQARLICYNRAKALFDFGYEKNKIVILQSTIMLTFWCGTPNDHWSFYTWISISVTSAETMGIHRSTTSTNMASKDQSLLKRLWWVLVVRDAFCSNLFGRPLRINMAQCDTEPPSLADFRHDLDPANSGEAATQGTWSLYQVEVAKLALLLREIIAYRFNLIKPADNSEAAVLALYQKLQDWRAALPASLDWRYQTSESDIFSSALSILYDHHLIFIHLGMPPTYNVNLSPASIISEDTSSSLRLSAAQRIVSLAGALVTKSIISIMPHEMFVGIFTAEVVLYTQLRNPDRLLAQLARTQLDICQMALHGVRDYWDSAPWVMQLFNNLITASDSGHSDDVTAARTLSSLNIENSTDAPQTQANAHGMLNDDFGLYDTWPGHPVFSNLLEMPHDATFFRDLTDLWFGV